MTKKIISGILIGISLIIGIRHGLSVFGEPTADQLQRMTEFGIGNSVRIATGVLSIALALLILIPRTFVLGNVLRATMLVTVMIWFALAGDRSAVLVEIPFLLLPLALLYLGHPLKKKNNG